MGDYSSVSSHPLRLYANRAAQRNRVTKKQGMKVPELEHADAKSTPEQILTPSTPSWIFALLIGLGLAMIGLVWWFGVFARPALEGAPITRVRATPQVQSIVQAEQWLLPTPTPSPESATAALAVSAGETANNAQIPLPTVTPSPVAAAGPPRSAEISGVTTLRLELSNATFASSGEPMQFTLEPRTNTLSPDGSRTEDTWCLQMGVHNLQFDLILSVNPANQDLQVNGAITLRAGFCDNPGAALDEIPVSLAVPADATARIAYSLHGKQQLLDVSDLLNAEVAVTVELALTNPRLD